MNAKEFLNNVSKEIRYKPANKYISDELESHIEELKNDNLCKGLSEEQAEETAVEQMGDAKKIGKRLNKIHRPKLDWKLIFLIAVLIGFRIVLDIVNYSGNSGYYSLKMNRTIKYILIGGILTVIIYFFDYRRSKNCSNLFFTIATAILIFQWINAPLRIDNMIFGDMYLLNLRVWNVAIPLYIISFAGYMADYKKEDFWYTIILFAMSSVLIYLRSHSITNTLILIVSYLTIVATKILKNNKKSIKKVVTMYGGTLSISIIAILLMNNIDVPFFFYGWTTEEDYAYNGYWYENTKEHEDKILNDLKWVGTTDEQEELYETNSSHFRFLYILGRLGIIPGAILAVTIIFMCVRIVRSSKNIKDLYGKYLIIGLGTTYIMQSIIHILMNLKLWIRSDINLPFVAEGNLYFLINCFTFAVILSVYRRKDINFEEPKKSKLAARIEDFLFEEVEEKEEGVEVTNAYK